MYLADLLAGPANRGLLARLSLDQPNSIQPASTGTHKLIVLLPLGWPFGLAPLRTDSLQNELRWGWGGYTACTHSAGVLRLQQIIIIILILARISNFAMALNLRLDV